MRVLFALGALALVAACGKDEVAQSDGRSASGEVLEGSVSDAMLPLDRVRSEPPLEDPDAFEKAQAEASDDAAAPRGAARSDAPTASADDDDAAPAPVETPETAD
jgi:hypothetical protein